MLDRTGLIWHNTGVKHFIYVYIPVWRTRQLNLGNTVFVYLKCDCVSDGHVKGPAMVELLDNRLISTTSLF